MFYMGCPRGAPSSRFKSHFPENIDFEVFTSTYAEFDADHENDLGFLIWGCLGLPEKNSGRPRQPGRALV